MFDCLSSNSRDKTPSNRKALADRASNVQATPSKKSVSREGSATKSATPLSVKLTPSIQRITKTTTPNSRCGVRKLRFDDTPAFLRRDSQHDSATQDVKAMTGDGVSWSPVAVRKFPQLAGRSLSSIVRGLREMEEKHLDEELELMHEIEGGDASAIASKPMMKPRVLVEDSQLADMPLGPDGGLESEDESVDHASEGKGRDGKPLKVWKKKGQKRTTRRVNMRPNLAKWKPEEKWKGDDSERESEVQQDEGAQGGESIEEIAQVEGETACEDSDSTDVSAEALNSKKSRKPKVENKSTEGMLSKAKKKISATAHANFRALKIRNKNSKGKRRRFGKRR